MTGCGQGPRIALRSVSAAKRRRVRRVRAQAGVLALLLAAAGCAGSQDHLDRLDRVSHRAGDAQARNIRVHAVDPVPPEDAPPPATHDGRRLLIVMENHFASTGGDAGAGAGGAAGAGETGGGAGF